MECKDVPIGRVLNMCCGADAFIHIRYLLTKDITLVMYELDGISEQSNIVHKPLITRSVPD